MFRGRAHVGVAGQHPREHVARAGRHVVGDRETALDYLLLQILVVSAFERETAVQHGLQENTAGIDVNRGSTLLFFEHDFRGHVAGCAAKYTHFLVIGDAGGKAEVNEFHVVVGVQQHVFQLNITVCDALAVAIAQREYHLSENALDLGFIQAPVGP